MPTKKPTIIFLHGFPFNATAWDPQVQFFKDKMTTIACDLRGHGRAKPEPGPWMMAHFADDLKKMMDQQQIGKAILCGVSMGGYIALHFISQNPDRVQALILSDTQAGADSNEAKDKRYATILKVQQAGVPEFAKEFAKNVLSETTTTRHSEIYRKVQDMILANSADNITMTLGALASRKDSTDSLPKILCPTLVVVGEQDKVTSVEVNEKLAQGIKGSVFKKIANAGHLPNVEQAEIFNKVCEQFLQSL